MAKLSNKTIKNIVVLVIVALVIIALVTAIIIISVKNKEVPTAEASVTRGSLSTSINASGVVASAGINENLPLFAAINNITDYDSITEYTGEDFNWSYALINSSTAPIVYRVQYVNPDFQNVKKVLRTGEENVTVMKVAPYYINWSKLEEAKDEAVLEGILNENSTVADFVIYLLGTNNDNPFAIPSEYLELSTNPDETVSIDTNYVSTIIEKVASLEETSTLEYSISNLKAKEGDTVTVDYNVFKISLSQLYTSFTVTEYDANSIHAKISAGEKAYAGVTINALNGRKVVAEIQEIIAGAHASGISYYAVKAKIIFGIEDTLDLTKEENLVSSAAQHAKSKGHATLAYASYTYYDPSLTPEKVEALGVDITDRVEREEVLENYSVAIKVQKEAVIDKLIIPTKCIFYDDSKNSYVLVTRGNRESRVYVKVLLSTGSEAAVEVSNVKDENALTDGDKIIYQAESSLISSILG